MQFTAATFFDANATSIGMSFDADEALWVEADGIHAEVGGTIRHAAIYVLGSGVAASGKYFLGFT